MDPRPATSIGLLCARLAWMLFGPLTLLLLTLSIVSSGAGWLTLVDGVFFLSLGAMLVGRWMEYRSGKGQTATGEPMNEADLRGHLLGAAAVGLFVWVAANAIGNHLL